jgi:uncharacterized protein YbjT (DUF2867 family)
MIWSSFLAMATRAQSRATTPTPGSYGDQHPAYYFHEHRQYGRVVAILLLACFPRRRAPARGLRCAFDHPHMWPIFRLYSQTLACAEPNVGRACATHRTCRVAPISRDDVGAAVAAVAAKPNKSRIIYMITGHRALGFGEIAASYGETIVRQVRYRPCSIDKYLTWASARLDDP